jgi:hypothetical protein
VFDELPNPVLAAVVDPKPVPDPNPPVVLVFVLLPNKPPVVAAGAPNPEGFAPKGELFVEPNPPPEPNPPDVAVLPPPKMEPLVDALFVAPNPPVFELDPNPPPLPNPVELLLL